MRASGFTKLLLKAVRGNSNEIATVPLTVQAVSGQTGNLIEVLDASGNRLFGVGPAGKPLNDPTTVAIGQTQFADVSLTNAEIKALRATPKTLVAAPGAGRTLFFEGAQLLNVGGTNALTESTDNLGIKYTDGSGAQVSQDIEATGFVDQTAATLTCARPKIDAIVSVANGANKALVLHNTGDGEYGGNAAADVTFKVRVFYRVLASS
jgi:hypothetical protein